MEDVYCFGGNPLDRASERRDDGDWIAKLLGDPGTRLLRAARPEAVHARHGGAGARLAAGGAVARADRRRARR